MAKETVVRSDMSHEIIPPDEIVRVLSLSLSLSPPPPPPRRSPSAEREGTAAADGGAKPRDPTKTAAAIGRGAR